jgi:hypothetical protein
MVRSIASPVDGARVPSTEVQAPQLWVVIRPPFIQSRTGMRMSISLGDFRVATYVLARGHPQHSGQSYPTGSPARVSNTVSALYLVLL